MNRLEDAIRTLADRWDVAAPEYVTPAAIDLDAAAGRLLFGAPTWAEDLARVEERPEFAATAAALRDALEVPANEPFTLAASADAARAAAIEAARQRTGRKPVIELDASTGVESIQGAPAAVVIEPFDADRVRDARAAATAIGAVLILDESRSAFRVAGAHAAGDLRCFGASLAGGLAFGALAGADPATPLDAPNPISAAAAAHLAQAIQSSPIDAALADLGTRLRATFEASCEREDIHARLLGPAAAMRFEFDGQENAEAPLMAHHFGIELDRIGATPGSGWVLPQIGMDIDSACDRIDRAVARMRCLLIEHNSYLCGEVPFVFPGADPAVADRGIAWYRFPKLGPVDLSVDGDGLRICFVGGELGEVTSSGFYLPTLFTGDFVVQCSYEVHTWEPGPDSACFALFAQNLASSARYYAQRMSDGSAPDDHRVLGSLATKLSKARPATERIGEFRIVREGTRLTAWHRTASDEGVWQPLATDEAATQDDVVFGAKTWSKVESGTIDVTVRNLAIDAKLADEQIPRLEHRDDPRAF